MTDRVLHIKQLKEYFKGRPQFSIDEIQAFYRGLEQRVKKSTLYWRIHELKNRGVIHKVGRGKYSLQEAQVYRPDIDIKLKKIYNKIRRKFPLLKTCIWNSKWLNEFMIHQPFRFYILVEVEKDGMESIFYFLQDYLKKNVYLNPSGSLLEKYVTGRQDSVLVMPLISEAPLQEVEEVNTVTLEKMLVDIYCKNDIFAAHRGHEMETIFVTAFEKYLVHEQGLLRYASRRGKRNELKKFIKSIQTKSK